MTKRIALVLALAAGVLTTSSTTAGAWPRAVEPAPSPVHVVAPVKTLPTSWGAVAGRSSGKQLPRVPVRWHVAR